jgi:hypothetical protein
MATEQPEAGRISAPRRSGRGSADGGERWRRTAPDSSSDDDWRSLWRNQREGAGSDGADASFLLLLLLPVLVYLLRFRPGLSGPPPPSALWLNGSGSPGAENGSRAVRVRLTYYVVGVCCRKQASGSDGLPAHWSTRKRERRRRLQPSTAQERGPPVCFALLNTVSLDDSSNINMASL